MLANGPGTKVLSNYEIEEMKKQNAANKLLPIWRKGENKDWYHEYISELVSHYTTPAEINAAINRDTNISVNDKTTIRGYLKEVNMTNERCSKLIDKIMSQGYLFEIVKRNRIGKYEGISRDLETIKYLTKEDFLNPKSVKISLYTYNENIKIRDILIDLSIKFDYNAKTEVFYINLIHSYSKKKGLGKDLLYLATCKAKQLGLPIAFGAQPGLGHTYSNNVNEATIRKEEEKLLQYYNRIGFKRFGNESYSKEYGVSQHYVSDPENVIKHAVEAFGGERSKKDRRSKTRKSKKYVS